MDENSIANLTLASWAAKVWDKEIRGVPLQTHEAAVAYCLRQHSEWRQHWNRLDTYGKDNAKIVSILIHIYNDSAVKLQLDRKDPPEVDSCYQSMRGKGITDMDALHAIANVLQEQTWNADRTGGTFDMQAYAEKLKSAVDTFIEHRKPILGYGLRPR
jgi:hypothetical protein